MKFLALLAATLSLFAHSALAAEPTKLDVYVDGTLKHQVELNGPNANCRFSLHDAPNTVLELRLIAPEPLIVDFKETVAGDKGAPAFEHIKLIGKGSSHAVNQRLGVNFHRPYVLVRPE